MPPATEPDAPPKLESGVAPQPATGRSGLSRWLWLLAAASVLGAAVWMVASTGKPPSGEADGATDRHEERDGLARLLGSVQLTVVGAPPGSTILYEGTPVVGNPFLVRPSKELTAINIEAAGYEPYVMTVLPTKDTTVTVTLKPSKPDPKAP